MPIYQAYSALQQDSAQYVKMMAKFRIRCYRVDGELNVLVSDFGLSRDVYHSDYYRLTHKALLPIKWMAPESLRDQIYNEKTDVVSYL